jgi:hypothetical protein
MLEQLANKSTYEWGIDGNVVWIKDLDQGMSVTNNIENILSYIHSIYPINDHLVMYRDSMGIWDEYVVKLIQNTKYIVGDFRSLNERDYDNAIAKLRERNEQHT